MKDTYVIISSANLFFAKLVKNVGSGLYFDYTDKIQNAHQFQTQDEAYAVWSILDEGLNFNKLLTIKRVKWQNNYTLESI